MTAVTNIVLADALATPVNHTFIPLGPDLNGVWWFEDQSPSYPVGFKKISLQLVRTPAGKAGTTSTANRVNRLKIVIYDPTLEVVGIAQNGLIAPPEISYVERSNMEFVLNERDTLQNRKDLRKYSYLLLQHQTVIDCIESLSPPF